MLWHIYKVSENKLLGELAVKGIPPTKESQQVSIRFSYDLSGLLPQMPAQQMTQLSAPQQQQMATPFGQEQQMLNNTKCFGVFKDGGISA